MRFLDPRLPDRFWDRTEPIPIAGCWIWTGSDTGKGHGNIRSGGQRYKAHRFAYETLVGPIGEGLHLDHKCRVRSCVNPAHLEPVTSQVNTLRGIGPAAVNAALTHCRRGHLLAGDNLRVRTRDSRTERVCLACERIRSQRRQVA